MASQTSNDRLPMPEVVNFTQFVSLDITNERNFDERIAKLFIPDLPANVKKPLSTFNRTLEIDEMFQWFASQLKSFISEVGFDAFQFDYVREKLSQDFIDIISLARGLIHTNKLILKQYVFCRHVLEVMKFSTEELKELKTARNTAEFLLENIINLNIRIFTLFDSYGIFELETPGNIDKVYELVKSMCCWKEEFQSLDFVPDVISRLFFEYVNQAEEGIQGLWHQIV